jgi:thiol-disulfide isomerase/thioredoxin
MTGPRLWIAIAVVAAVGLGAGAWFSNSRLEPTVPAGTSAGPLMGISLPDIDGKPQALAQWQGKVVVVNFWATWCAPCREEMPMFVKMQAEKGPKGLQFVGIAVDQVDKVRQFADEIGMNYPALIGGYGAMELSKTMGNGLMALPFTVIVDRQGKVAHTQLGPIKEDQLTKIVEQLL